MAKKRKSLPNGVRFEVFKRDKFRCQYCGKPSPEAVLQVDHIHPVAEGGTDEIANLVTSCFECNSGKSDKLLSDDTAVAKQRAELERQQERLEQIEMIAQWRQSLAGVEERAIEVAVQELRRWTNGSVSLSELGATEMRKHIRKHGLEPVCEGIAACAERHGSDVEAILDGLGAALNFMASVSKDPQEREIYYIRGWVANRHGKAKDWRLLEDVRRWIANGWTVDVIKEWIEKAKGFAELDGWFSRRADDCRKEGA